MTDFVPAEAAAPRIEGANGAWEMVIGLEIHAQVTSRSKLFSGAPTDFGAAPNGNVSLVDAAMPGMLPVLNRYCVEQAVRTALGLGSRINLHSVFDRKNYFYPDLPQGYQISQYSDPIAGAGQVRVDLPNGESRRVGIVRLHLEQDAGKSLHDQEPGVTLVDLNRTGVALMEIVTEPDLRSPEEAGEFVRKLRTILRYLGTCDGNMEEGSMRADINVSVRRPDSEYGTRCEIKNINSVRFLQQAIRFESSRQIEHLEAGGVVQQETRQFDPVTGRTRPMRTKEDAHDYRYFPDPDLLPLKLDPEWVENIRASLPELPDERKSRLVQSHGISETDASILVEEAATADYFEEAARGRDPFAAANWIVNELFGYLNRDRVSIEDCPVSALALGSILDLISEGTISGKIAKEVLGLVWSEGGDPEDIVRKRGMSQVRDETAIETAVDRVFAANPAEVARAQRKPSLAGWFVGQVMKETAGRADPKKVNALVRRKLGAG